MDAQHPTRYQHLILLLTPYYVALVSTAFALGAGIWMLLPFELFRYPLYESMSSVATEEIWGAALVLIGAAMVYGWRKKRNDIFSYASFVAAILFFVMAVLIAITEAASLLIPMCVLCFFIHGYGYFAGRVEVVFNVSKNNIIN